jgi:hypothetical protein
VYAVHNPSSMSLESAFSCNGRFNVMLVQLPDVRTSMQSSFVIAIASRMLAIRLSAVDEINILFAANGVSKAGARIAQSIH